MDFSIVVRQIFKAYQTGDYSPWTYPDFVRVFERFYTEYENRIGCGHPVLKTKTIARVMRALIEDDDGMLYSPEDYLTSDLIPCYFDTVFDDCDYCIAHFVSGDVRHYRTFEAVI